MTKNERETNSINTHFPPFTTLAPQVGLCPDLRERMHSSHNYPWEIKDRVSKGGTDKTLATPPQSSSFCFTSSSSPSERASSCLPL